MIESLWSTTHTTVVEFKSCRVMLIKQLQSTRQHKILLLAAA